MPKYQTVREVAKVFRKSKDTIYRWIEQKAFKGVLKVRDGYLIPADEVEKLLKESHVS